MASTWTGVRTTWIARIERAAWLTERNPWAAELLHFYMPILEFQKRLYDRSKGLDDSTSAPPANVRRAIDLDEAARPFPELMLIVQTQGPSQLAEEARRLRDSGPATVRGLFEQFLA